MKEMIKKVFNSEIKSIDEKEMTLTAFVSTAARDRYDEVLDPKGVDISNYNKNPVVLWAHKYDIPPIGKALWTKRNEEGVISKVKFASTPFAQEIFQLYKEGFLKAFSVGFMPIEYEDGDGKKTPRRTYKKWEMLEYSAVPIPANPEALALAVQRGICSAETKKAFDMLIPEESHYEEIPAATLDIIPPELGELLAENNLLSENVKSLNESILTLEKEIKDLRFKIYSITQTKETKPSPEITADVMANLIVNTVGGVIRKHQGKVSHN